MIKRRRYPRKPPLSWKDELLRAKRSNLREEERLPRRFRLTVGISSQLQFRTAGHVACNPRRLIVKSPERDLTYGKDIGHEMYDFEPDYYEILDIDKDASDDAIKSAFRKQAKLHHPDTSREEDEKFIRLRKAYETLLDQRQREKYDRYLQILIGSKNLIEVRVSLRDLYDDMIGYLSFVVGIGNRAEFDLVLKRKSYDEDKIIRAYLPLVKICRSCMGTGGTIIKECERCGGKGKFEYTESVDLYIPAGSREGESMIVSLPKQKVKLSLRYE